MPTHVSIGTAIDKNRIASNVTYLLLLEVDIINADNGTTVETLFFANNNEVYQFQGNAYLPTFFEVSVTEDGQTAPTATLTVQDLGQVFQAALQAYAYGLDWPCRLKAVNVNNPSPTVDSQVDFTVVEAKATGKDYAIEFTLGTENPLTLRYPPRQQFRERCFWKYKGDECRYAGALPTCDYTLSGTNGCRVHNNTPNFGGFPGINRSSNIA